MRVQNKKWTGEMNRMEKERDKEKVNKRDIGRRNEMLKERKNMEGREE